MSQTQAPAIIIHEIKVRLSYPTPFGDLQVTQDGASVELEHGPITLHVDEDGSAEIEISWISALQGGASLGDAIQDFRDAIAHWSRLPKASIIRDGILPPVDARSIMEAAHPSLLQAIDAVSRETFSLKLEAAKDGETARLLKSLPHGALLLDVGVVADFDPLSDKEDVSCVCLLRLVNQPDRLALERCDGGILPEYFEDPASVLTELHPATSERAAQLLADLPAPARKKLLFGTPADLDSPETLLAAKCLADAREARTPAPQRPPVATFPIEEWLQGIEGAA